ncbi:MAG: copper homeostasis protein CutC [Planctomycetes bacterium]|nr:copper homeostasis protein CutC [Planctomycetota bacterium]
MPAVPLLLEVCVDSRERLSAALAGGARRIELCARLDLDGLSPEPELLEHALATCRVPLHVMVRPAPGPFRPASPEFGRMLRECEQLARRAPGLVLGLLDHEERIDLPRTRELVAAARPAQVTFHRAFDRVCDFEGGLEQLIELGVSRVLTSGGAPTAWEGRARLAALVERARGRIGVLPGGGVRADHARALAAATGATELHSSTPFVLA